MIKRGMIAAVILMAGLSRLFAQAEPPSQTPGQIPTSFKWYYHFDPEGWRYWSQSGATEWIERYDDGTVNHFKVLNPITVAGCHGIVLLKENSLNQVFIPDNHCASQNLAFRFIGPAGPTSDWKLAGAMQQIQYAAATPAVPAPAPSQSTDLYALDKKVAFNVLDQVEYDAQSRSLILVGHNDTRYKTPAIPYFDYLAAFLDYPAPKFSLEWTPDSERRVDNLRVLLQDDNEWRRLAREWGTWLDNNGALTPAGRFFMPKLGVQVADNMDRFQILANVFIAANKTQAAIIVLALRDIESAWPHPSKDQLSAFIEATGTSDYVVQLNQQVGQGTLAPARRTMLVYRAMWQNMDRAFGLTQSPLLRAFDAAIQSGQPADAAFDVAVAEFNRQIGPMAGSALSSLLQSKSEIQVPISLVNPSLSNTLIVQPRYIDIGGTSLLAKLMFDADYATKSLVDMPELTAKIPRYQTEFAFRQTHPAAALGSRVANARLWISIDRVDASQSPDGNVLALEGATMRINLRDAGGDDASLAQYANLLTSLYDDFAQNFSPLLHELREAAKLGYAAQWLRSKNVALKMPPGGRGNWNGPATARGIIFVAWSPRATDRDVITVSAVGGIDFSVPPPPSNMRANPDIAPANDLIGAEGVTDSSVQLTSSPPNFPAVLDKMVREAVRLTKEEEKEAETKCEQGAPVIGINPPEVINYPKTGQYGERALQYFYPDGKPHFRMDTIDEKIMESLRWGQGGRALGIGTLKREVDLFLNGICMEAKEGDTGPTSPRVQLEILKDNFLRQRQQCNSVEWHFFVSPTTKKCGPSALLIKQLLALRFRCVKHDDPRVIASSPNCRPGSP